MFIDVNMIIGFIYITILFKIVIFFELFDCSTGARSNVLFGGKFNSSMLVNSGNVDKFIEF